jgi:hypothetical protein
MQIVTAMLTTIFRAALVVLADFAVWVKAIGLSEGYDGHDPFHVHISYISALFASELLCAIGSTPRAR